MQGKVKSFPEREFLNKQVHTLDLWSDSTGRWSVVLWFLGSRV